MLEILLAFALFSAITAGWAYARARALHWRIEAMHPGFNALMRHGRKRRREG